MNYLVDTNILVHAVHRNDPNFNLARDSIRFPAREGHTICVFARTIVEFWAVCTRPADVNGLGLSVTMTERYVSRLESMLDFFPDTPSGDVSSPPDQCPAAKSTMLDLWRP